MLPKIIKDVKQFLMDETGSISKKNVIKGAIFLSALGTSVRKAPAISAADIQNGNYNFNVPLQGGETGYYCGGEEVGTGCNGLPQTLKGGSTALWECERTDCTWTCEAKPQAWRGPCCTDQHYDHRNSGTLVIQSMIEAEHANGLSLQRTSTGYEGSAFKYASHTSVSDMDGCQGTTTHANHCSHENHSEGGWC
ncbi:hypothetical protein H6503_01670 [Candidatus Woesearchaeota archaeon]|nr:hypothetical protein [Candidatus Woesearchaeota archaeon]